MAKVWFFKDGKRRTYGETPPNRSLPDCIRVLCLDKDGSWWPEDNPPIFGDPEADALGPNKYVVVQVYKEEADNIAWKPGYYLSPLTPQQAFDAFGLKPPSPSEPPIAGL
jgi:hypothetical protein